MRGGDEKYERRREKEEKWNGTRHELVTCGRLVSVEIVQIERRR